MIFGGPFGSGFGGDYSFILFVGLTPQDDIWSRVDPYACRSYAPPRPRA